MSSHVSAKFHAYLSELGSSIILACSCSFWVLVAGGLDVKRVEFRGVNRNEGSVARRMDLISCEDMIPAQVLPQFVRQDQENVSVDTETGTDRRYDPDKRREDTFLHNDKTIWTSCYWALMEQGKQAGSRLVDVICDRYRSGNQRTSTIPRMFRGL